MVYSGLSPQLTQAKSQSELTTGFIRQGEEATAISMLRDYENSRYPLIPYQLKLMTEDELVDFYWDFQNGVVDMSDFITVHVKAVE